MIRYELPADDQVSSQQLRLSTQHFLDHSTVSPLSTQSGLGGLEPRS